VSASVLERPASDPGEVGDADCCRDGLVSPISAEEALEHARVLKALADPNRLRILALIAAQPASEALCACDVEASFELSQPTISHHLRVLREAGLISVTKRGLWHYYAVEPVGLAGVQTLLGSLVAA
jgi:ArsR family transcriptional regulator, arsenate/arsenite/antimonite-responsive transcriptional repressor